MKTLKGLEFVPLITKQKLQERILELAIEINKDLKSKDLLVLAVLNGSFMFLSDLCKQLNFDCQISFLKVNSYEKLKSSGKIKELIGLESIVEGREVLVVEDIVDTGQTMKWLLDELKAKGAKTVKIASLLLKPNALQVPVNLDYCGFKIANDFVVGYGLDYNGFGRNWDSIYVLKEQAKKGV